MKTVLILKQSLLAITLTMAPHFAQAGGTGPGGGGSILCWGKAPELTDFWEASQKMPSLKPRLEQLRKMNESQAVEYFADRLNQYYEGENSTALRTLISRFMMATKLALNSPNQVQTFTLNGQQDGLRVFVGVNTSVRDPQDSGDIFGLLGSQNDCREERVAISSYVMNNLNLNTKPYLQISIRNPQIFQAMSAFDQIGLIMGHEILHGFTVGRLNIAELESLNKKDSAEARQLNAWLSLSSANDMVALRSYRPYQAQKISCSAVSQDSDREGYYSDRIHFNLFVKASGTLMEIKTYKDEKVQYPSWARLNIPSEEFRLPESLNLNVGAADTGRSFDLKMNMSSLDQSIALIYQRVPSLNSLAKDEVTENLVSFKREFDGRVILSIDDRKTKLNKFRGNVLCYSLATDKM